MYFQHSDALWAEHPDLVAGTLLVTGLHPHAEPDLDGFTEIARARLAGGTEADLPEIQAWRRTFARMGLKPTQYRCASEALLRRFRKEGALPRIHPVIDVCNAVSLAFAIPVGVLDVARIGGFIEVRHADGSEEYLTFGGTVEKPDPGEVVFADADNRAHSRRWTNRQSGYSAVRDSTRTALVVVEAVHATAADDVPRLIDALAGALTDAWGAGTSYALQSLPQGLDGCATVDLSPDGLAARGGTRLRLDGCATVNLSPDGLAARGRTRLRLNGFAANLSRSSPRFTFTGP